MRIAGRKQMIVSVLSVLVVSTLRISPPVAFAVSSPFAPTAANTMQAPVPAPYGMVWIPGGEFSMGSLDRM